MFSSCGLIGTDRRHRMSAETYSAIEIVKAANKSSRRRCTIATSQANAKQAADVVASAKRKYCNDVEIIEIDRI